MIIFQKIHPTPTLTLWCCLVFLCGCGKKSGNVPLSEARQDFETQLVRNDRDTTPPAEPPPRLFRLVKYRSPAGEMAAYLTPPISDGRKHPAIIWIFGGFGNGIDGTAWEPAPTFNDQSASVFRELGIVMMYPSMRGGSGNPGSFEGFYGEVDDVIAAADFLAKQDHVDPERIYLGGHSTGGTLVLLVSEMTNRFRAAFAFGPVENIKGYGRENVPIDLSNRKEVALRSPINWLNGIRSRTFVFEGTIDSNISSLRALSRATRNPAVRFHTISGEDHFSCLAPVSRLIAKKILEDNGPECAIQFTKEELTPNR